MPKAEFEERENLDGKNTAPITSLADRSSPGARTGKGSRRAVRTKSATDTWSAGTAETGNDNDQIRIWRRGSPQEGQEDDRQHDESADRRFLQSVRSSQRPGTNMSPSAARTGQVPKADGPPNIVDIEFLVTSQKNPQLLRRALENSKDVAATIAQVATMPQPSGRPGSALDAESALFDPVKRVDRNRIVTQLTAAGVLERLIRAVGPERCEYMLNAIRAQLHTGY